MSRKLGQNVSFQQNRHNCIENNLKKTSRLTYFDVSSSEKIGCQSNDERQYFASIWGRTDFKNIEISTDEIVENDIFKDDTDGNYHEKALQKHFQNKLHIKEAKNRTCKELTYETEILQRRQNGKEKDSITTLEDKQVIKDDYKRIAPTGYKEQKDRYTDHEQTESFGSKNVTPVRHKECKSNHFDFDENIDTVGHEIGLSGKGNLEVNPADQVCIGDCSNQTISASKTTEDFSHDEEQMTEEELTFKEMMTTFDKFYPDDNDSSTLYELVLKQGFKTKTRELFDTLKEFASSNGFEIKDSAPNGNCMFHAVNDQLIINGDFRFNEMSLRKKAVTYLEHHPKNKEDIHLECFLIDEEKWDAYLERMSKSKEWGDHLIIKALCEVLHRKIVVHNVQSAESLHNYEFIPETSETGSKEDFHLGHLGEFHYTSLRPSNWKQSWLSKIIRTKEEDLEFITTKKKLYAGKEGKQTLLEKYGFDRINKLFMPIFSVLQVNLLLSTDIIKLQIPSKIVSRYDDYHVETAGGRSDGTEIFYRLKDPSLHTAECYRRTESECPHMIMVKDDEPVTCSTNVPHQEHFMYADTSNCHPGYCRLLYQSNNSRVYLHGWNVTPHLDPNDTVAKRSVSGYPCNKWPHIAMEWLERNSGTNWPEMSLKEEISEAGCLVIKRAHPASPAPEIEWLFLFNKAEKKLMANLSSRHKRIYYMFKIVVDFFTKNLKMRLHTVHLKSIFLFACEELHERDFQELPGYCFLFMIQNLLSHLNDRFLPNYFIKENNMIDHFAEQEICQLKEMVELVRVFPLQSVSFLLEEHGHFRSWIIDLLKCRTVEKHSDVFDIVVPAMVRLSQHLARDEQFHSAYHKITDVHSFLSLMPFYKNGRNLPAPKLNFLIKESFQNLDEYTKCRIAQVAEREAGINTFASLLPTKNVKDLMGGKDIAGFGEEAIPDDILGDDYYEAHYLNSLGVSLHTKDRNYKDASKYYFSSIDHLEKSSEKIFKEIQFGGTDRKQAERHQQILENDSLAFTCFQNLSRCTLDNEMKQILKLKMPLLETICARSHGKEYDYFVKKLWERLGYPD